MFELCSSVVAALLNFSFNGVAETTANISVADMRLVLLLLLDRSDGGVATDTRAARVVVVLLLLLLLRVEFAKLENGFLFGVEAPYFNFGAVNAAVLTNETRFCTQSQQTY